MTKQETLDAVAIIQSRAFRQPASVSMDAAIRFECNLYAAKYVRDNPRCTLTIPQLAAKLRSACREVLIAG